jgi:hypothetical protein
MKLSMKEFVASLVTAWFVSALTNSLWAENVGFDVSQVVDKAAAEAVLGETVKTPTPRNLEGKDGFYSKCNYYGATTGKTLIVRVYQAAAGFDPAKELETVAENTGAMRAVSGLGEKARISSGAEGGLPSHVVMLYVVKGNALITIGLGGVEDDAAAAEKVKSVAQKILAKL